MSRAYPDCPEWLRISDMRASPNQGNRQQHKGKIPWTPELEGIALDLRTNNVPMPAICLEIERLTGFRISVGGMRDYLNKRADPDREGSIW